MGRALTSLASARPTNPPGNFPRSASVSPSMTAGAFSRIRDLWLQRQSRCPACDYDLRGITASGPATCPECGRSFTPLSEERRPSLLTDGRDSLRRILTRSFIIGVIVAAPWHAWLAFIVWRISLQRRPSGSALALVALALGVCSIAALTWSAHAATIGSARLFNLMVRALIALSASALAGWLLHLALWWGWKWAN